MGCSVSKGYDDSNVTIPSSSISVPPPPVIRSPASGVGLENSQQAGRASTSEMAAECLSIVHFNDVYDVQERKNEPVGGAARFKTKVDSLERLRPLVIFSGDCLNPSPMSVVTEGRHMVPVLKSIGVHVAAYGNHEFDFGIEHLVEVAEQTEFPWLMSNVRDKKTGRLLAEGKESLIIDWEGRKIGLIGLVEWEWLVTLATIEPEDLEYTDFVDCARQLLPALQDQGCDLLVAVTHMRWPNDRRLAREVPEIHLILGGHDHDYQTETIGNTPVIKSGSDFRQFSEITVHFSHLRPSFEVIRHDITRDVLPDPDMQAIVQKYGADMEEGMKEEIGSMECDLEGRFCRIRTGETNLGNLVTDIMRKATRSDIALLNSGTFRSDAVHQAGVFRVKDLMAVLPMVDPLWKIEVTGTQVLLALENGVSQYPRLEGRFPQVSGISFTFDPSLPSGSRVSVNSVVIGGERLQRNKTYTLCTKGYIAAGKDGYDVFRNAKTLLDHEAGIILNSVVRNHFQSCRQQQSRSGSRIEMTAEPSRINPIVEGRITSTSCG